MVQFHVHSLIQFPFHSSTWTPPSAREARRKAGAEPAVREQPSNPSRNLALIEIPFLGNPQCFFQMTWTAIGSSWFAVMPSVRTSGNNTTFFPIQDCVPNCRIIHLQEWQQEICGSDRCTQKFRESGDGEDPNGQDRHGSRAMWWSHRPA